MTKFREFWIHLKSKIGDVELSKNVYFALSEPATNKVDHEVLHVVEYSALEASQARENILLDALVAYHEYFSAIERGEYNDNLRPGPLRVYEIYLQSKAKEAIEKYNQAKAGSEG